MKINCLRPTALLFFTALSLRLSYAVEEPDSCAAAPNCVARNREECVPPATSCGVCLSGFISSESNSDGYGNTPCIAAESVELDDDNAIADLPIIDLDGIKSKGELSINEEEDLIEAVKNLCLGPGFAYLKNHGINEDLLSRAMGDLKDFFDLPLEQKQSSGWTDPAENSGYVRVGGEGLDEDNVAKGDPKESYDMNKRHMLKHPFWNTTSVVEYWEAIDSVKEKVLLLLTKAMQLWIPGGDALPDDFLISKHKEQWNTLRLLNYIPLSKEQLYRCGPHTDYGTFTLIYQDEVGGLEVFNRRIGRWQAVEHKDGTIVLNLADLLNRWTNGMFLSTVHRVVSKGQSESSCEKPRNSLVYFVNPDQSTLIDPKSILGEKSASRYPPITAGDYLVQRLTATFNLVEK